MSHLKKKVLLKVLILGDSGVGKTSLMNRFVDNKFSKLHKTTIGADFLTKQIEIDNTLVTLQIVDTAGQERFQSLVTSFYRGADALILVYDMTNIKSFKSLDLWIDEFKLNSNIKDIKSFPIIVLGNKCDLAKTSRKVSKKQVGLWCQRNSNRQCYETSAKDGINVNESFHLIAKQCMKNQLNEKPIIMPTQELDLRPTRKQKDESNCCNVL